MAKKIAAKKKLHTLRSPLLLNYATKRPLKDYAATKSSLTPLQMCTNVKERLLKWYQNTCFTGKKAQIRPHRRTRRTRTKYSRLTSSCANWQIAFAYCFTYSQIALLTALLVGSDTADEADKDEIIALDKQVLSLLSLLEQQHKF
jgi:hypothetical protein